MKQALLAAVVALILPAAALILPAEAYGQPSNCPAGRAWLGCALGQSNPLAVTHGPLALAQYAPVGGKIPDVSSYQGHPDWSAAKAAIVGAMAKAGEYVEDPDFVYNWDALRSLRIWHTSYWFVRPTGCTSEADHYVSELNSVGYEGDRTAGRPVLDIEVPGTAGYATCMADVIHQTLGVWPVLYLSPVTWPGGSSGGLNLWVADYSHLPCVFTCYVGYGPGQGIVAWQYTDGVAGYPTYVPGLGYQDMSIDYGITRMDK